MSRLACLFVAVAVSILPGCGGGEEDFGATIPPAGQRPAAPAPPAQAAAATKPVAKLSGGSTQPAAGATAQPGGDKLAVKSDAGASPEKATPAGPKNAATAVSGPSKSASDAPAEAADKTESVAAKTDDATAVKKNGKWVQFPADAKDGEWESGYHLNDLNSIDSKPKNSDQKSDMAAKIGKGNAVTAKSPMLGSFRPLKSGGSTKDKVNANSKDPKVAFADKEKLRNRPDSSAKIGKPNSKPGSALSKLGNSVGRDKIYERKLKDRLKPYAIALAHLAEVSPVAVAHDGQLVGAVNSGQHLVVYDGESGEPIQIGAPFPVKVTSMAFNSQGTLCFAGLEDGSIHLRVVQNFREIDELARAYRYQIDQQRAPLQAHTGPVSHLTLSGDGQTLVSAGGDGLVKAWRGLDELRHTADKDLQAFSQLKPTYTITDHIGAVAAMHITRDDAFLSTSGEDKSLRVYLLVDGTPQALLKDQPEVIRSFVLNPERGSVLGSTIGVDFFEWSLDPEVPAPLPPELPKSGTRINRGKFVQRGWSTKGEARSATFYVPWQLMPYDKVATFARFSPDGTRLAIGSGRGIVQVWTLDPLELKASKSQHALPVTEIRWMDNSTLISVGHDRSVKRWDTTTDREVQGIRPRTPDDRYLASRFQVPRIKGRQRGGSDSTDNNLLAGAEQVELFSTKFTQSLPDVLGDSYALRTAAPADRDALRQKILAARPKVPTLLEKIERQLNDTKQQVKTASTSDAEVLKLRVKELERQLKDASNAPPLVATIPTEFELEGTRTPTVRLKFSGDSSQIVALQSWEFQSEPDEQHVYVWDTHTGERVRHWHRFMHERFPRKNIDFPLFMESAYFLGNRVMPVPTKWSFQLNSGELRYWGNVLTSVDLSPNGRTLIAGVDGKSLEAGAVLQTYDAESLEKVAELTAMEAMVPAVRYLPGGDLIVASIRERNKMRTIMVEAETLKEVDVIEEYEAKKPWLTQSGVRAPKVPKGVESIFVSPTGQSLVTVGLFNKEYVGVLRRRRGLSWDKELEDIKVFFTGSQPLFAKEFDGEPLVFVGSRQFAIWDGKAVRLYSSRSGKIAQRIPVTKNVLNRDLKFRFDPKGRWFAVSISDGKVFVGSLVKPEREPQVFVAATTSLKGLEVSPDGQLLATIGENGELMIWDLANWIR